MSYHCPDRCLPDFFLADDDVERCDAQFLPQVHVDTVNVNQPDSGNPKTVTSGKRVVVLLLKLEFK